MWLHVLFLLPIVVLFADGLTVNDQQSLSLSSLYDRIQRMEAEQTAQNEVISRLNKKMIDQEKTIQKQSQKLQKHEHAQTAQDDVISRLIYQMHAQSKKLVDQEETMTEQAQKLQQQNEKILYLKSLIGLKSEKMSHREKKPKLRAITQDEDANETLYQKSVKSSLTEGKDESKVHVRSDDFPMETVVQQLNARVTQLSGDVQALKTGSQQHGLAIKQAGASVFTRWGAGSCPAGASLAYSGTVAGGDYLQSGAAVNFLCATMKPHLSSKALPPDYAELWGAEYESYDQHQEVDAICAVCVAPHPSIIMVPGVEECLQGWTRQYHGYLMTAYGNQAAASEFICVDAAMEGHPGTKAHNDNGKLLYYTVTHCGSLPCEPYQNGKIVPCAVCSK